MADPVLPAILVVVAFLAGVGALTGRHVLRSKRVTQFFAGIAIGSTAGLVIWGVAYLP